VATHHTATPRSFFLVFAGLMVLAASSYALSFAPIGSISVPVAMLISASKALLVVLFFMELVGQRFFNRFVVVAAVVLLSTLISLMAADVLTRETPPLLPPDHSAGR
jgi:cytochrome c oxidase subunit 4